MRAISCGTLIDGLADEPISDAVILTEDGKIRDVGPADTVSIPSGAERIDHSEGVVLPGLIDAHLHIDGWREHDPLSWVTDGVPLAAARATADLRELLSAGFTAIRDVGSRTGIGLKQAVDEGAIPGPRLYTSGRIISQTAGHGDIHFMPHEWVEDHENWIAVLADGEAEFRKEARKLVRDGVDCLKIMTTGGVLSEKDSPYHAHMTDAEIRAVVEEAHRVDIPVASHAEGTAGIESALRNGVDTIEHGFGLTEELVELMLANDAILVPTLAVMEQYLRRGEKVDVPDYAMEKIGDIKSEHLDAVELAYESGVSIALGTDFSGSHLAPHGENVLEAELLVEEVGMSELDVIKSATSVAAETIPDDALGGLTEGNYADLLVVDGNPLDDISHLRSIDSVYKGGEAVSIL